MDVRNHRCQGRGSPPTPHGGEGLDSVVPTALVEVWKLGPTDVPAAPSGVTGQAAPVDGKVSLPNAACRPWALADAVAGPA